MEKILEQLGGLLLKAAPTFLLVVLLHFYMKRYFYRPMDKVLQARRDATEGRRKQAEAGREKAATLAAECETSLNAARSEIYREQEELRRKWSEERSLALHESRAKSETAVKEAKAQVEAQVADVRKTLVSESDRLAAQIAQAILRGRRN